MSSLRPVIARPPMPATPSARRPDRGRSPAPPGRSPHHRCRKL